MLLEKSRVEWALQLGCREFGLQSDVSVLGILHGTVVVLGFDQDPHKPNFAHHMIKLERWMKKLLQTQDLELQCEPLEDKNKRDVRSGRVVKTMVSARNVEELEEN